MSEFISDEQLFQLFHNVVRRMKRAHHGDLADRHSRHERHPHDRDSHVRRHLLADGQARHAQGHILSILNEREGLSQRELLDMLQIRSASLSELLFKLKSNNLIFRQHDETDKRNFRLYLTESGRAVVDEHRQHRQETATRLFSVLSEAERTSLANLLTRLLARWEEEEAKRDNGDENRRG
ncbi:MAG: MarR family transcriptional regulator [Zoogloeaceae bacterium]|nr:MarR family transcriptional regulator [Zoogloeaceae bacterium]